MPRSGGVYQIPAGTKAVSGQTIQSVPYNTFLDDFVVDANAARPVTAGGTGATTATDARTNLGVANFVDKDAVQTLTNKSLQDSTTFIIDETDATKRLQFQVSSITTATTRTVTWPDASGTVVLDTATQTLSNKTFGGTIFTGPIFLQPLGNAKLEVGRIDGSTSTPSIDFHSGATATDYDARIISSGGNGSNAGATLTINSTGLIWNSAQIADISTSQTFTNKTLTSPVINGGTISNPALTGTPTAPTAAGGTNTTQVATTAFVTAAVGGAGAVTLTGAQTVTGLKSFSLSGSTTAADFMIFRPTDYATGKPSLRVHKSDTSGKWDLLLYDGIDNSGQINFLSQYLTWNDIAIITASDTQTITNKTIIGGTINPTILQQSGVQAVTVSGTQTLTNKTLTSPAIDSPTLTGTMSGGTVNPTTLQQGGSQAYVAANILGTVSQASGVPTGAVIERGSNVNGEFVKFADGTMVCNFTTGGATANIATGSVFRSSPITWTFPVAFAAVPYSFASVNNASQFMWASIDSNSGSTTQALAVAMSPTTGAGGTMKLMAVGRWF